MAEYSGTPLAKKLGIGEGMAVSVVGAPPGFAVPDLPPGVRLVAEEEPADVVLCFATEAAAMNVFFRAAIARVPDNAAVWTAWPKACVEGADRHHRGQAA